MTRGIRFACALCLCLSTSAFGGLVLTPLSAGSASATVEWGDSFTLDFELTSDAGDVHDSAVLQVVFTEPGLIYEAYDWTAPYSPLYDDSDPLSADLSVILDGDTLSGSG